jgi:hypothetical protein
MGFADVLAVGVVLVPLVYAGVVVAGKVGSGPLSSRASRVSTRPTTVPDTVSIGETETIEYRIDARRDRWKRTLVLAVILVPVGWGAVLLIYAYRVRNRAGYVVTDQRVIEETRDDETSYDYESIGQVQGGSTALESLVGRGHVEFSIDNRDLVTVGWLRNPDRITQTLRTHSTG